MSWRCGLLLLAGSLVAIAAGIIAVVGYLCDRCDLQAGACSEDSPSRKGTGS